MATVVFAAKPTGNKRSRSKHEKRIDRIDVSVEIVGKCFVVGSDYFAVIFVGGVKSERAWHVEWPVSRHSDSLRHCGLFSQ